MIQKLLESIDLTPEEGRIYTQLLEKGSMAAGQLAKTTGLSRPSVYDHLKNLTDIGLVKQSMRFGVKSFYAAPPEQIGKLLDMRLKALEKQKSAFETILPTLTKLGQGAFVAPQMQMFEGADGVRHVLMDMLMYRDMETRSFWPIQTMVEVLSPEFFHHHNKLRIESNLSVKAIWPLKKSVPIKNFPFLGAGKGFLRDIRIAPDMVDMQMGYWIYGTKTAFLSSSAERFGFIIESVEFAQMMSTQHEILWKLSKKLPIDPEHVRPFLREIGVEL